MYYSKSFFIAASVLISNSIFAADTYPYHEKNSTVHIVRHSNGRNFFIKYSAEAPIREIIKDFKKQAGISDEMNIKLLNNGIRLDENALPSSYSNFGASPVFALKDAVKKPSLVIKQ